MSTSTCTKIAAYVKSMSEARAVVQEYERIGASPPQSSYFTYLTFPCYVSVGVLGGGGIGRASTGAAAVTFYREQGCTIIGGPYAT